MWITNGKPKRKMNQPSLYLAICLLYLAIQVSADNDKRDLNIPTSRARARAIGIQIGIYHFSIHMIPIQWIKGMTL